LLLQTICGCGIGFFSGSPRLPRTCFPGPELTLSSLAGGLEFCAAGLIGITTDKSDCGLVIEIEKAGDISRGCADSSSSDRSTSFRGGTVFSAARLCSALAMPAPGLELLIGPIGPSSSSSSSSIVRAFFEDFRRRSSALASSKAEVSGCFRLRPVFAVPGLAYVLGPIKPLYKPGKLSPW
jgi:hypothetical protein